MSPSTSTTTGTKRPQSTEWGGTPAAKVVRTVAFAEPPKSPMPVGTHHLRHRYSYGPPPPSSNKPSLRSSAGTELNRIFAAGSSTNPAGPSTAAPAPAAGGSTAGTTAQPFSAFATRGVTFGNVARKDPLPSAQTQEGAKEKEQDNGKDKETTERNALDLVDMSVSGLKRKIEAEHWAEIKAEHVELRAKLLAVMVGVIASSGKREAVTEAVWSELDEVVKTVKGVQAEAEKRKSVKREEVKASMMKQLEGWAEDV